MLRKNVILNRSGCFRENHMFEAELLQNVDADPPTSVHHYNLVDFIYTLINEKT